MTGSGPASARPRAARRPRQTCVKPAPRNDDTIHIQGCLLDQREKPAKPVPGVKITVEDDDRQGRRQRHQQRRPASSTSRCPGKSIDNLGKTFTVKIDKTSLPEGRRAAQPRSRSR